MVYFSLLEQYYFLLTYIDFDLLPISFLLLNVPLSSLHQYCRML